MLWEDITILIAVIYVLAVLAAVLHILLNMGDESDRAVMWLIVVVLLPVVGLGAYLLFGVSRRDSFGNRILRALDEIGQAKESTLRDVISEYNKGLREFLSREKEEAEKNHSFRILLDRMFPENPPLKGNSMTLLRDGNSAYPKMLESIRSAKTYIHMQSFIIARDEIGKAIFDALEERARAGLDVRVIYDGFGSFGAMASHFFQRYQRTCPGLKVRSFSRFNPITPWGLQLRNHRKLLVVDGKTAYLGGLNISAENFTWRPKHKPAIHDLHARVRGPGVLELETVFLRDWCIAAKEKPESVFRREFLPAAESHGENRIRVIPTGHGYCYQGSSQCFYAAATTAKQSIWLNTPYFVPDRAFLKVLRLAAQRGVDVRILVPRSNNHWFMKLASRSLYEGMLSDGVRIFERIGNFSHAKAMLTDNEWALFGSSNCDIRSFRLNYELDMVISGGSFIRALHEQLVREFETSEEVRLEQVLRRPMRTRLAESLCALFSPIL